MITLQSDTLQFIFPQIGQDIQRLVDQHIESTIPRLLSEDREAAVTALSELWAFRYASSERQRKAQEQVRSATADQIVSVFRRKCLSIADLYDPEDLVSVRLNFQRTLRIPDDGKVYPLPAGLGAFPLRHVDDFKETVPTSWLKRSGVMMPMHQSEALWLKFIASYPVAMMIGAGKINAISGETWSGKLERDPQNYLVLPEQPWLDGFSVGRGMVRQFVAMPLGNGYSVEEQLTGKAETGGIQIQVFPMKTERYFENQLTSRLPVSLKDILEELVPDLEEEILCCAAPAMPCMAGSGEMGLGAGGMMRQEIYRDPHNFSIWNNATTSRCFVHLCNSLVWRQITGSNPPHPPLTAKEYARAGVPWFDYYRDDLIALEGSEKLGAVKSVSQLGQAKGAAPLPAESSISPELIIQYGNVRRPDQVREWNEP